jgi:Cu-processing system permease protein
MTRHVVEIARLEWTAASRLWWMRLFTAAFALLTIVMTQSAAVQTEASAGDDTFARLTVALLPLALMLVPLAALLVGVSSVSHDAEASGFLLTLPVSAAEIVLGRWAGQAASLTLSIAGGFMAGAAVIAGAVGTAQVGTFAVFVIAAVVLAFAFLSAATLIAAVVSTRGTALGLAAFVWFAAVILYDAAALGVAVGFTGRVGTRVLFASVFGNAVDLVRVLTLLFAGTPHILGAAGESWMRTLGGPGPAIALALTALAVWIVAPLAAAVTVSRRRDL